MDIMFSVRSNVEPSQSFSTSHWCCGKLCSIICSLNKVAKRHVVFPKTFVVSLAFSLFAEM